MGIFVLGFNVYLFSNKKSNRLVKVGWITK
ncbi:hypothetical protein PF672P2_00002 [Parabacteroides phage PF672P2]|nr:hypothetical protein PF672P2_00002 [Parabacteroides phage PF672P2]